MKSDLKRIQQMETELHPWLSFIPEGSHTLIIGTFPSAKKNRSFDFFYPNKLNLFWRIMAAIAEMPLQKMIGADAIEERKMILEKLKVGITDMGHTIQRNGGSSLDEHLVPLEYMNIFSLLEKNPTIRKLVFTSSSGPQSASRWFNQFLKTQGIQHSFPKEKKPIKSTLFYGGKKVELIVLHSPSPRAANRITFDALLDMYKYALADKKV